MTREEYTELNAPVANLFTIYATLDAKLGAMGITAFLIERDTPGLTVTRSLEKTGLRTSPMAELALDACSIPAANRMLREGCRVAVLESSMKRERSCTLANYLGLMRRQLGEFERNKPAVMESSIALRSTFPRRW